MKKLLLIASALLAFTFFGCDQPSNPSSPDTGKSDVVTQTPDDSTGGEETPTPEPIDDLEISLAKANWGWGYNSSAENASDGSLLITLTADNGAGSFGYSKDNPGDWSKYNTLVVELGDSTNWNGSAWAQTTIKDHEGGDAKTLANGFDVTKGAQTLEVDLTEGELVLTKINQVAVQGNTKGTVIQVVKCYLTNK